MAAVKKNRLSNRWLELIAAYKLLQALLLVCVGVGALRLVHKDVADVVVKVVRSLHMNPEWHLVSLVLDKAGLITDHRLRQFSVFVFAYAGLGILEGVGLLLEKSWAEYLTSIITASFLPIEIHELFHRFTWLRIGIFLANILVLAYLIFHLIYKKTNAGRLAESKR